MFRKLDLFPSSGDGKKTPTLLGPLERADLNHWVPLDDGNVVFPTYIEFSTTNKVYRHNVGVEHVK
jgi:hypothetical protein